MAQTPTIHAPGSTWRDTVTACGKKAGETTTDPAGVTCNARACEGVRERHEAFARLAARTEATLHGYLEHGYGGDETLTPRQAERNAATLAAAACLSLAYGGALTVESPLGVFEEIHTVERAMKLHDEARNLMNAAYLVRQIIEARAYMAEYRAQKAGAL